MSNADISLVLPCRNEEPTIGEVIKEAKETFSGRMLQIVVPDNSTDRSPIIASRLGALVVRPPRLGYGAAYRYAFRYCKGSLIGMMDPDGTYDVREMPLLLRPLEEGRADLVMGSRLRGAIDTGAMPWYKRRLGNPLLTQFLDVLFGLQVSDAHCGMRALTKEALACMNLKCDGMEFASEMLVEAARRRLRIEEVPISYRRRRGAPSKLSSIGDGWRHLRYMAMARLGMA